MDRYRFLNNVKSCIEEHKMFDGADLIERAVFQTDVARIACNGCGCKFTVRQMHAANLCGNGTAAVECAVSQFQVTGILLNIGLFPYLYFLQREVANIACDGAALSGDGL